MSDYDEGNNCPECGCTMMNGTSWCFACGYGMDQLDDEYEENYEESDT